MARQEMTGAFSSSLALATVMIRVADTSGTRLAARAETPARPAASKNTPHRIENLTFGIVFRIRAI